MLTNFLGGLGGLGGKRLDFGRDHGKTAACIARPRSFDGGVQRQKIGLFGNGGDELENVANALGRPGEFADARIGLFGLENRLTGNRRRLNHLSADFVDRRCHLFRRGCNGLDVG